MWPSTRSECFYDQCRRQAGQLQGHRPAGGGRASGSPCPRRPWASRRKPAWRRPSRASRRPSWASRPPARRCQWLASHPTATAPLRTASLPPPASRLPPTPESPQGQSAQNHKILISQSHATMPRKPVAQYCGNAVMDGVSNHLSNVHGSQYVHIALRCSAAGLELQITMQ